MKISLLRIVMYCLIILIGVEGRAQDFDTTSTKSPRPKQNQDRLIDRFFVGGGLGAQFGTYTFINVSPLVGFKLTPKWSIGTRGQYQYFKFSGTTKYSTHVFGGSFFTRYFIFDNFFAHAEYELLNGYFNPADGRSTIPHLFVGGGYLFRLSDKVGLGLSAMYEVLQRTYSPYRNPIINAGITIGL